MRIMRALNSKYLFLLPIAAVTLAGFKTMQDAPVTQTRLREMLVELGYEVTDLNKEVGKEKYSVKFEKAGFNIPVGFEISPSKNYIWLTVNLGPAPTEGNAKCLTLLKQNSKVQPCFFYITDSGTLMMAQAIENRGVTNAILRQRAEFVSDNVGKTQEFWK